jgi:RNA polymerase sigma-70 factor (ECF subfamily)
VRCRDLGGSTISAAPCYFRKRVTDPEQAAFAAECEAHRRMLRVHCYRMTGSFDDAEDLVQETFMRAWRSRASFEGRAQLSTWLHRIATNACLDALAHRPARVLPEDVVPAVAPDDEPRPTPPLAPEVAWMQPFPDRLLDPEAIAASRESIELAFLAALQHLPPRQRAILILCDVLGWSAKEVAGLLELTVAAVTSALPMGEACACPISHRARRCALPDDPRHDDAEHEQEDPAQPSDAA